MALLFGLLLLGATPISSLPPLGRPPLAPNPIIPSNSGSPPSLGIFYPPAPPSLTDALETNFVAMTAMFEGYRKNPPPPPSRPNWELNPFLGPKNLLSEDMKKRILHECPRAVVVGRKQPFDAALVDRYGEAGASFIHVLVLSKSNLHAPWEILDPDEPVHLTNCFLEFINQPDATQRLVEQEAEKQRTWWAANQGKPKWDKQRRMTVASQHFLTMCGELGNDHFKMSDFRSFYHMPSKVQHLHMHMALDDAKWRKYSQSAMDGQLYNADAVRVNLVIRNMRNRLKGRPLKLDAPDRRILLVEHQGHSQGFKQPSIPNQQGPVILPPRIRASGFSP